MRHPKSAVTLQNFGSSCIVPFAWNGRLPFSGWWWCWTRTTGPSVLSSKLQRSSRRNACVWIPIPL